MSRVSAIALDISLRRTGWAIGDPDMRKPQTGVLEFPEWSDKTKIDIVTKIYRFLEAMHLEYDFTDIGYEMPFVSPQHFNLTLLKVQDAYEAMLWLFVGLHPGIRIIKVPVEAWRERFLNLTPQLKRKLAEMKREHRLRLYKKMAGEACADRGWYLEHHDECEACGILDSVLCLRDPAYAGKTDPIFRRAEVKAIRKAPDIL